MTRIIAPSILSADFGRLAETIRMLDEADCDWIHFDVMDGTFVPPITFGAQMVAALRPLTKKPFDCHLMVDHPETQIEMFRDAGVERLTVHVEACRHLHRTLQEIRQAGLCAGVAFNPGTPINAAKEVLDLVDLILVMTVNPGWGGQEFIRSCLRKIQEARQMAPHHHVEVDGGIDAETVCEAAHHGANVFVVGSYAFSGEPKERISTIRRALCEN